MLVTYTQKDKFQGIIRSMVNFGLWAVSSPLTKGGKGVRAQFNAKGLTTFLVTLPGALM